MDARTLIVFSALVLLALYAWRGPELLGWYGGTMGHCTLLHVKDAQTTQGVRAAAHACGQRHRR